MVKLAKLLNLNAYQLSELINTQFRKHYNDFINHYRVQEAKNLMKLNQNTGTRQICYESGFNTYSSFHRAFQKETGKSPDEWRKNHPAA